MAGQRPPRAAVRAAVRTCLADLAPGERVVVALSGGPDSLALTAAVVAVGAELGLICEAVVVDHQLQAGSGEVARSAAEQARILGCADARVVAVEVASASGSGGPEAAARAARYAALDAVAAEQPPAAAILLGHTREDQAETVLLGLARGSGTRSLAGMAARSGCYRRPLIELPREVVAAAAREAAVADPRLEPWTDPHNSDSGFARVRVRDILPVLEAALGPGIVEALARTATLAREDADALDAWAERVWGQMLGDPFGLRTLDEHQPARITGQMPGGATGAREAGPIAPSRRPTSAAQQLGMELPQEQQQPSELTTAEGTQAELVPTLPIDVLRPEGDPLPAAIVNRVVRRFLIDAGCPTGSLTAGHIRAVAALLEPDSSPRAEVALPGGHHARREAGALVVRV